MTANITALIRYAEKGKPGEHLQEVNLHTGLGMEGNLHQGGERQLCLLTAEIRQWMDSPETQKGLCFERFKENIRIAGMPGGVLPPGARLQMGEAVLQVSAEQKHCHPTCTLVSQGIQCRLADTAVFALVQHGGLVRIGDCVTWSI